MILKQVAVGVDVAEKSTVKFWLSDAIVIDLFMKTMVGFCPVCTFNKVPVGRHICDECLEREKVAILPLVSSEPYTEALTKIMRYLMPDPPVTSCIGASATIAIMNLGEYTRLRAYGAVTRKLSSS